MTRQDAENELREIVASETQAWARCKALLDERDMHLLKHEAERQYIVAKYAAETESAAAEWRPLFLRCRQLTAFIELT